MGGGVQPGGSFEAAPPVLMVAIPELSEPGDFVVFDYHKASPGGSVRTERCRAQVPDEWLFGRYFAARLPKQMVKGDLVGREIRWGALRAEPIAKPLEVWVGTLA